MRSHMKFSSSFQVRWVCLCDNNLVQFAVLALFRFDQICICLAFAMFSFSAVLPELFVPCFLEVWSFAFASMLIMACRSRPFFVVARKSCLLRVWLLLSGDLFFFPGLHVQLVLKFCETFSWNALGVFLAVSMKSSLENGGSRGSLALLLANNCFFRDGRVLDPTGSFQMLGFSF